MGFFEFNDGKMRASSATTTAGGVADFIRCNWITPRRRRETTISDWECRQPLASGRMGPGSTVEMKCARCHNFIKFFR